jgi:site-specific DNA recombinase
MPPRFGPLQADKGGLGAHSAPNPDRYAYTNHVLGNGCDNARAVDCKALETRVLTAHDDAADAMRAHMQETNRLNR